MQKAKFFVGIPGSGKTTLITKISNATPLKTLVIARGTNQKGEREYNDLIGNKIDYVDIENHEFLKTLNQTLNDGNYERIIVDEMNFLEKTEKILGSIETQQLYHTWLNIKAELLIAALPEHFIEMLVGSGNGVTLEHAKSFEEGFKKGIMFDSESFIPVPFSEVK